MKTGEKHFGPLWFLPGRNRGRYPCCHSLFLQGPGILIDPGSDRNRLRALREEEEVTAVWLSHWHEDHFKNLDLFDDLPLYVSEPDALPLSGIEYLLAGYDPETEFPFWKRVMEESFHFRPRVPTGYLVGGETMRFPGMTVDIIASPGHTPGHVALYFREQEILFLGDYDLTLFGPWYGDHNASIEETIVSLQHLQTLPARIWLTSHERGIFEADPGERWRNYEGVIHDREAKLLSILSSPRSLEDIARFRIVFRNPREPRELFESGEKAIMKKHLDRLLRQKLVREDLGRYVRI